jgi:hypothetical protein
MSPNRNEQPFEQVDLEIVWAAVMALDVELLDELLQELLELATEFGSGRA